MYVAWCFPALFGARIDRSWTATLLSAPSAIFTSPATCFSARPVGHFCRKNREYYSILTHWIMECLAWPYNGKTTLNCQYMWVYCIPVNHTTMQCATKQQTKNTPCRIYEGCDVCMSCYVGTLVALTWRNASSVRLTRKSVSYTHLTLPTILLV